MSGPGSGSGSGRMLGGSVEFVVPVEVAFDYLVDPANRPDWQSSLKAVEQVEGSPRVGQTWVDVTVPGLRPAMRTTVLDRPRAWSESGTWRFVTADLALRFEPDATGERCSVEVRFRITGPGPMRALGLAATAVSVPAVLADVRHAARILAGSS